MKKNVEYVFLKITLLVLLAIPAILHGQTQKSPQPFFLIPETDSTRIVHFNGNNYQTIAKTHFPFIHTYKGYKKPENPLDPLQRKALLADNVSYDIKSGWIPFISETGSTIFIQKLNADNTLTEYKRIFTNHTI